MSVQGLPKPLLATGDHPVLTDSGWRGVQELRPGVKVLASVKMEEPTNSPNDWPVVDSHTWRFHFDAMAQYKRLVNTGFDRVPQFAWNEVRSIRSEGSAEPVYSFECIPAHTYLSNGITLHNCRYCQNADISQRRKVEGIEVEPQDVVRMTLEQGCQGLAYTYNQPTIFIEFARDIGMLARKAGLINLFVSNGYDTPETVAEMP